MPSDSTRPPGLGPVLLVNFIGTLGFTIAIPFMVYLVTRFGGNISKTAKFIGMERSALHRKLKSLGMRNEEKQ